jgi:hypothetical protein
MMLIPSWSIVFCLKEVWVTYERPYKEIQKDLRRKICLPTTIPLPLSQFLIQSKTSCCRSVGWLNSFSWHLHVQWGQHVCTVFVVINEWNTDHIPHISLYSPTQFHQFSWTWLPQLVREELYWSCHLDILKFIYITYLEYVKLFKVIYYSYAYSDSSTCPCSVSLLWTVFCDHCILSTKLLKCRILLKNSTN